MWKPNSIGQVVATHELFALPANGQMPKIKCSLSIGIPVREPSGDEHAPWACPIELRLLLDTQLQSIFGENSFQALSLAIQFVPCFVLSVLTEAGMQLDEEARNSELFATELSIRELLKDS